METGRVFLGVFRLFGGLSDQIDFLSSNSIAVDHTLNGSVSVVVYKANGAKSETHSRCAIANAIRIIS